MPELPISSVERLLKNAGAERIGEDAAAELRELAEEKALKISKKALALAKRVGRKTVKAEDVKLAAEL